MPSNKSHNSLLPQVIVYDVYNSPIGEILILGNKNCITSVIFANQSNIGEYIKSNNFMKVETGKNSSANDESQFVKRGVNFLKRYFSISENGYFPYWKIINVNNRILHVELIEQPGRDNMNISFDINSFTEKEIAVYIKLMGVPFGESVSYKVLSELMGIPGGARFAGNTMAKNKFPIFIPCHRVIKSNGDIGGYSAGIENKKYLLGFEGLM
ncbi:methylated-DNA--[protein]-cysteine S-methyltransferase [Spirochaetota bacterium]